jgi:glycosyltransferase involved in cell wall biosynthesis
MNLSPAISIVIPCYNSEDSLPKLIPRLKAALQDQRSFEVILVEDCSRDNTWGVVQALAREYPFVHGFQLMRNYGQHNALLCGIRAAHAPVIVTMDDDLQNPPEEVPRLLAKLAEGYDVVYGTPERESHGVLRDLASQITKLALQKAMGAATARNVSAFRAFRTRVRDGFAEYRGVYVSIDVLLTWGARRFTSIAVRNDARTIGVSNYTFYKLLVHALNMVTGFTTIPLQLASLTGFLFTLVGAVLLLYVLTVYFIYGSPVQGFPFLASMVALFSGAQLFALGIMGEYLARIHVRTMDRPTFVVNLTTDEEAASREHPEL